MFKIEDISAQSFCNNRRAVNIKYPFDELNVGQSFFVEKSIAKGGTVRVAASRASHSGKIFTTGSNTDGCRVFRVK